MTRVARWLEIAMSVKSVKKRAALAAAMVAIAAAPWPAHAAIIISVRAVPTPPNPNNLFAIVVSLSTNAPGGVISAFHGTLGGNVGFQGNMNQVLAGGVLPTPTSDLNAVIDEALDTQFLLLSSEILAVTQPFETATTIGGVFTYQVAARAQSKDILRIVSPFGSLITYGFHAAEAVGATSTEYQLSGSIIWFPEPHASTLGGMALVSLAASRRRRATPGRPPVSRQSCATSSSASTC
jgi:hypothetical protein